ncbi:uncharacterized protein [Hemitrygon akajei]|uniref:uncharacterized protein n=1 Tax=Hemitrygon akajei TaxID=2704970 RepID=UPI003BF99797
MEFGGDFFGKDLGIKEKVWARWRVRCQRSAAELPGRVAGEFDASGVRQSCLAVSPASSMPAECGRVAWPCRRRVRCQRSAAELPGRVAVAPLQMRRRAGSEGVVVLHSLSGKCTMPSKNKGSEIREKDARRALDMTPANETSAEQERDLLKHELENLQQMNLSLQAVLQMVVSFKKTVEEVTQKSDHFADLNDGWSTFFSVQKSIQN